MAGDAAVQQAKAVSDINAAGVDHDSKLYVIVTSILLGVDGAAIDSPLNDAP